VRLRNADGSLQPSCRTAPRPFDLVSETLALASRFPRWSRPARFRMLDWDYGVRRYVDCASGAFLVLRRRALEDVGPFDERFFLYYEEADWLVRAKARGWRTLFLPAVEAVHDAGTSSGEARAALSLHLLASQHRYVRKHHGRSAALAHRAVLTCLDAVLGLRAALPGAPGTTSARTHRARLLLHLRGG
jgi:N-acetylglucosaminyl-diphospho-decaprenol L-rhamnosyltransferase